MTSDIPSAKASTLDFFVSYTEEDLEWAEWVAWQLEDAGYSVLFQAWDMVPGTNWVNLMRRGISQSERTVAVMSGHYLSSIYGQAEWNTVWADDPLGEQRKLLVLRVTDCQRPDVLRTVVSVDLFGRTGESARELLLQAVKQITSGRAKPAVSPAFPSARTVLTEPTFPPAPALRRVCVSVGVDSSVPVASHMQLALHEQVRAVIREACMRAGADWELASMAARDDGLLIALAPGIDEIAVIPALMEHVRTGAQAMNVHAGRLRLRVGIAQGTVQQGTDRLVGRGVDRAVALSGSDDLVRGLGSARAWDVAFAVADDIFQEITGDRQSQLLNDGFYRVHIVGKLGVRGIDGWVSVPPSGRGGSRTGTESAGKSRRFWLPGVSLAAEAAAGAEASTVPGGDDYGQAGMPEDDPDVAEISSGLELPEFLQQHDDFDSLLHDYADDYQHPMADHPDHDHNEPGHSW
jgi:hypothetical protein